MSLKERAKAAVAAFIHVPTARHDERGLERPDPTPVELPLGMRKPPTIHEMIQRALRSQAIMQRQLERGEETLEESMDYDVDEDELPITPHEMRDMQEEVVKEGAVENRRQEAIRRRQANASKKADAGGPPADKEPRNEPKPEEG